MATAIPVGQQAVSCELCELDQKIKWFCIQCKSKICGKCEKVHRKIQATSDHTILDIKDVCIDKLPTHMPDFTKMKCPVHPEQYCCLFCSKCDTLVCAECITNTHKKHKLKKISEEYEIKLANSERYKADLDQEEKSLKEFKTELRRIRALQRRDCSKTKEDIALQEKTLMNAVKEHSKKLAHDVEYKYQTNLRKIEEKEKEIENTMECIQKKRSDVDNLLRLDGSVNIFTKNNLFSVPSTPKLDVVRTELAVALQLVPGDARTISTVFGKLQEHASTDITTPKILSKLSTKLQIYHDIVATHDGIIWMSDLVTKKLLKTKLESQELKVLAEYNISVKPSLYNNGDLLLAPLCGSVLQTIKAGQGEITNTKCDITPGGFTSIHWDPKNNKILAGVGIAKGQDERYNESQLIEIDKDGNKEVFHHDSEGRPMFKCILSIACTSQGTVGLIDGISYNTTKRKVIILGMHGQIHQYHGNSPINSIDKPFSPCRIIASPWNNFIITDCNNDYFHILDEEGSCLALINTKELGIELPLSLSFTDHLFIGCGRYDGQKEGAKIYELADFPW